MCVSVCGQGKQTLTLRCFSIFIHILFAGGAGGGNGDDEAPRRSHG